MSWARYDDELAMNRKVVALRAHGVHGVAALGLHLLANTWCRHNGTSGHVPTHVAEVLAGRPGKRLATILVTVGMFDQVDDGWQIHDYADFHDPADPSPDRSAAERRRDLSAKRASAGRKGGLAKASKAVALPQQTSSPVPVPVPVPGPYLQSPPSPDSLPGDPGGAEDDRIGQIADRYAELVADATPNVRSRPQFLRHVRAQILERPHSDVRVTEPEIVYLAHLFPTAPPSVVACWLAGDKGTMRQYPRADELDGGDQ